MKHEFAVAEIGTHLLHPERYATEAEAQAAITAHGVTAPMYQLVELRYENLVHQVGERVALVRENEQRRHEKHVAEETEREGQMTPEDHEARADKRLAQRRAELDADETEHKKRKSKREGK